MAQHDYNIANASFPTVRTDINNVLSAVNSSNSGSSRPSSAVAGTIWLDTSGAATAQLLKMYDGAADITLATVNFTANTVDFTDSSVTLANDSVTLAKMAGGTDGNIISYDASGDPVAVATGSDGQVLTSTGAGSPPAFEDTILFKQAGTNFANSLLVGHATSGTLNSSSDNTGVGTTALKSLTTGDKNTVVGNGAGFAITSSNENTAVGRNALRYVSTGTGRNVAIGQNTLQASGSGDNFEENTAVGTAALQNVTGNVNIGLGFSAGANITSGSGNVMIGEVNADSATGSRQLKITGNDGSTATTWISGDSSGNLTTTGDVTLANTKKVIFGDAGENIVGDGTAMTIASSQNITLDAAGDITINADGSIISLQDGGTEFLRLQHGGSNNTVIKNGNVDASITIQGNDGGSSIDALTLNMSAAGAATFLGTVTMAGGQAIPGKIEGTNFTDSLLIGHSTTGTLNNADRNVGIGIGAMDAITSADDCVFIGHIAGSTNTTGTINTGVGAGALNKNVNGGNNVAVGYQSLYNNNSGNHNTAIGRMSGDNITSGDGNVIIGEVDADSATGDRQLKIAGYDGTTRTTWIEGDNTGKVSFPGNDGAGLSILSSTISTSASNADITLTPHGTGSVVISQISTNSVTGEVIPGKIGGTSFANSLLIGHSTTGTLNDANRDVGVGIGSLDAIRNGDDNTAVGYNSGSSLTSGGSNTMIGNEANSSGNPAGSTSLGYQALKVNAGTNNIGLGTTAGQNITSGDGNVIIGVVDAGSATGDRQLKIAGNDGTTTTTWISGASSGVVTIDGGIDIGDANISYGTATTTSSSAANMNTFAAATYRSAKYQVSIVDSTNTKFGIYEVFVTHDGSAAYINAQGISDTGLDLATFSADIDSGSVRVRVIPISDASTVFKFVRTVFTV